MFERPRSGERALLVRIGLGGPPGKDELSEFEALARSAGAEVLAHRHRHAPRARSPSVHRLAARPRRFTRASKREGAELVLFDHALSPSQERNLEALLQVPRARSHRPDPRHLRAACAQLRRPAAGRACAAAGTWRRGWCAAGPTSSGRRAVSACAVLAKRSSKPTVACSANRIKTLNARLDKVVTQRETTRRERKRAEIPTVALVGYTNAGKSTLFNRLTGAGAYAADQLFATLDPTVRRLALPDARYALLADTVGFVRDLPHELVAAFRSTLQEAREASLLLHVIDAADPNRSERIAQVNQVLEEVGAGSAAADRSVQQGRSHRRAAARRDGRAAGDVRRVWLSAQTGAGMDLLVEAIGAFLGPEIVHRHIVLRPEEGRARARFFAAGAVLVRAGAARRRHGPRGVDAAPGVRAPVPQRGLDARAGRQTLCPPERFLKSRVPTPLAGERSSEQRRACPGLRWVCAGYRSLSPNLSDRPQHGVERTRRQFRRQAQPLGRRQQARAGPARPRRGVRNLQRRLAALFGGGTGGRAPAARARPARGFGIGTIVLVLLAIWAFTGLYTVDAAERGVDPALRQARGHDACPACAGTCPGRSRPSRSSTSRRSRASASRRAC